MGSPDHHANLLPSPHPCPFSSLSKPSLPQQGLDLGELGECCWREHYRDCSRESHGWVGFSLAHPQQSFTPFQALALALPPFWVCPFRHRCVLRDPRLLWSCAGCGRTSVRHSARSCVRCTSVHFPPVKVGSRTSLFGSRGSVSAPWTLPSSRTEK